MMAKRTFFFDSRNQKECFEHIRPMFAAMLSEEPLPCALLCAAYIDNCLKGLLEKAFIATGTAANCSTMSEILGMNGFLGQTFNAVRLAYCLSLIDKPTMTNIGIIAKVRNEFAHAHTPIDFDDKIVAAFCKDFTRPSHVTFPAYLANPTFQIMLQSLSGEATSQSRFVEIALLTSLKLTTTPATLSGEPPGDIHYHDETPPPEGK